MTKRRGRALLAGHRLTSGIAALLALGCTGSPDSVTVFGAHGQGYYDAASGARAFDSREYGYGVALTWALPTTRSMRLDDQTRDLIEAVQAMQRDEHDLLLLRESSPAPVVVTAPAPPVVEQVPAANEAPADSTKAPLYTAGAALALVLAEWLRRKLGLPIPGITKRKKAAHVAPHDQKQE